MVVYPGMIHTAAAPAQRLFSPPSEGISHPRDVHGKWGEALLCLRQQTWDVEREKPLQIAKLFCCCSDRLSLQFKKYLGAQMLLLTPPHSLQPYYPLLEG